MAGKKNSPASPKRPKNRRRISVLNILEQQLKLMTKPVTRNSMKEHLLMQAAAGFTSSVVPGQRFPLNMTDVARIQKQIVILKAKIIS